MRDASWGGAEATAAHGAAASREPSASTGTPPL